MSDGLTAIEALLGPQFVEVIEQLVDERIELLLGGREDGVRKRWLSVAETASHLGCSQKAVYARIDRERIPKSAVKRMGRSVLVDREALDRALDR